MMRFFFSICISVICFVSAKASTDAYLILDKVIETVSNCGVSSNYTITLNNVSQSGIFKMQGKNFMIENEIVSTWYDGKQQWNYNHEINEVTVSIPTNDELKQLNPYYMLQNYKYEYNVGFIKSKLKGTYAITLTPKNRMNTIKKVVLYIKSTDNRLVRADLSADTGGITTIILTNYKTGLNLPISTFVFPKNKYNSAKIIDLR